MAVVLYLCDRKACENCSHECMHTTDVNHAINFSRLDSNNEKGYIERFASECDYWDLINKKKGEKDE